MCPFCDRKIGSLKNGRRRKHYINQTSVWFFGYKLLECKGSSPDGTEPTYDTKTVANQRRNGKMKCLACGKWVGYTKTFLPVKHDDQRGRVCRGWSDNQN
ncbi:hypothetical protein [Nocardiopsis sp. LOL_012]|uniref:hypothetical protein n=1 Tax=Nocardiopsis sp. LOL_012 TaxID=3345409 RepID=UPI003A84AD72